MVSIFAGGFLAGKEGASEPRFFLFAEKASIEDPDVIEQMLKLLGLDQVVGPQNRSPPLDLTDQQPARC